MMLITQLSQVIKWLIGYEDPAKSILGTAVDSILSCSERIDKELSD